MKVRIMTFSKLLRHIGLTNKYLNDKQKLY